MSGAIYWEEIDGQGFAVLVADDGTTDKVPFDGPIDAGTDSGHVAGLFGLNCYEHDKEFIFVENF